VRTHKARITAVALGAAFTALLVAQCWLVDGYRVSGACMEPSMHSGERVLVTKFDYWLSAPHRDEVVVFHYPRNPRLLYLKRIAGLPGDTVEIRGRRLLVNGRVLPRPASGSQRQYFGPVTVPAGTVFVLGDNQADSNDSRFWGPLPQRELVGKVRLRYWPPTRAGLAAVAAPAER